MTLNRNKRITMIVLSIAFVCVAILTPVITLLVRNNQTYVENKGEYTLRFKRDGLGESYYNIVSYNGTDTIVNVPSKIEKLEVRGIAKNAFSAEINSNNKNIIKITLPDTIRSIGENAFSGLENITEIIVPSKVSCIEHGTFKNNTKLNNVTLSNNAIIKTGAFDGANNFTKCNIIGDKNNTILNRNLIQSLPSSVKELTTNENIKIIESNTFDRNTQIRKYAFSGVETVKSDAFSSFLVENMKFSNFLASIESSAFNGTIIKSISLMGAKQDAKPAIISTNAFVNNSSVNKVSLISSASLNSVFKTDISMILSMPSIGELYIDPLVNEVFASSFGKMININIPSLSVAQDILRLELPSTVNIANLNILTSNDSTTLGGVSTLNSILKNVETLRVSNYFTSVNAEFLNVLTGLKGLTLPLSLTGGITGTFNSNTNLKTLSFYGDGIVSSSLIKSLPVSLLNGITSLHFIDGIIGTESTSNVALFSNMTSLSSVTFNEGFKVIGDNSFSGIFTNGKVSIEFPSSIEEIGKSAFLNCSGLISIGFKPDSKLAVIKDNAFKSSSIAYAIDLSFVKDLKIGSSAFASCVSIPEFIIDSTIITTGTSIISGTKIINLKIVNKYKDTILESKTLKDMSNDSLLHVIIAEGITAISSFETSEENLLRKGVFGNPDITLTTLTLPSTLTEIGDNVFAGLKVKHDISCDNLTSLGKFAFAGAKINQTNPNAVLSFPSLRIVQEGTFQATKVGFLNIVKINTISNNSFNSCEIGAINASSKGEYNLDGISDIGINAFDNCALITKVDISVFYNATILKSRGIFNLCSNIIEININSAAGIENEQGIMTLYTVSNEFLKNFTSSLSISSSSIVTINVSNIITVEKDALAGFKSTINGTIIGR
ncbi:MAG: leucine-rich repeat protein [Clostridia bacterium]